MALRVLLADESSTIKKVFQLALQDFAVEVKPVALGIDVQAVASEFEPDIVFADILLQKKNGYEVCADLKSDDQLQSIPVVLMWSGFMELDTDKFEACGADERLEKPFDVAQLRQIIQKLVPKTKTQPLSEYLEFPDTPEVKAEESTPPPEENVAGDEDEFQPVSIPQLNVKNEKFQVETSPDEEDEGQFVKETSSPKFELEVFDDEEEGEDFAFHRPGQSDENVPSEAFHLSQNEVREIVERLAPKIIEEIVWKVVPDLATQVIEREIKTLLAEKESEVSP